PVGAVGRTRKCALVAHGHKSSCTEADSKRRKVEGTWIEGPPSDAVWRSRRSEGEDSPGPVKLDGHDEQTVSEGDWTERACRAIPVGAVGRGHHERVIGPNGQPSGSDEPTLPESDACVASRRIARMK